MSTFVFSLFCRSREGKLKGFRSAREKRIFSPRLCKQFSNQLRSEGKGSSCPNATAGFFCAVRVCLEKEAEKKRRREEEKRVFLLISPPNLKKEKKLSNSTLTVCPSLSLLIPFSALLACKVTAREKEKEREEGEKERKEDLRLKKKKKKKGKCREPKFGRSQGKSENVPSLAADSTAPLLCAPPPEWLATPSPEKGARARRRAGREDPRYRGEGKKKCKRPAGNGEGGQREKKRP